MRFAWALVSALVLVGCGERRLELFPSCDACGPPDASPSLDSRDPERCGSARRHCEDDEYCVEGACVCREALIRIGEDCVDPSASRTFCGDRRATCQRVCEDGACVLRCSIGLAECEGGCVDVRSDPLHCGECGRPCGAGQVCVDGRCARFRPVDECADCGATCCAYPTRPLDWICVEAASCG